MQLRRQVIAPPTWWWDSRGGALHPAMSFSRASSAAYFDASGVQRTAGVNVPRFDCDPLTGTPLGYLAEMQSTNVITNSRNLAAASWGGSSAITRTANAVIGPDGTLSASTITEDTTNARHECDTVAEINVVAGAVYGVSFSVKQVVGSRFIHASLGGVPKLVAVNPATGAIGTVGPNTSAVTSRQLPNGWWRIGLQLTAPVTANGTGIYFSMQRTDTGNSTETYTGDGTSTVAITDVQFETAGVGVTSVISTNGAAATRAQDVLSMPLTSLPGWNGSQGGVFTATYRLNTLYPATPGYNQSPVYVQASSGYLNSVHMLANYGGAGQYGGWMSNASVSLGYGGASSAPFVRRRQALGWQANRVVSAVDGGGLLLNTTTLALPTSLATAYFGAYGTGGHGLGGTLESISYYAGARSDAFVQWVSR